LVKASPGHALRHTVDDHNGILIEAQLPHNL